ncbi:MAG: hypothetical protein K8I29_02315 [Alphaproteobacteria bacterium]|uniref:Uncharacterized protein n=1 Tax=Candidatus Nitrobium versatile TaxID=2884831 RepID=A0A953J3S4_9BACT|nr:hypothetical protein [Candidatus Nitrobium versatile]
MKVRTLIALIAFIASLFAPFQITVHPVPDDPAPSLFTLNVCHASGAALSVQADIPCITEPSCTLPLFEGTFVYMAVDPVFHPFLIAFRQEHPPKV